MAKKINVVIIGGGTGSPIVISALKSSDFMIYSLVPMGDSGGSTGKLRDEFGVLSAGEIRERLIAMAAKDSATKPLKDAMDHRFTGGKELKGHNLGNIIIAGLTEMYGSQSATLDALSRMFKITGEIIPTTFKRFDLAAEYIDGSVAIGEHNIDEPKTAKKIARLFTVPRADANPRAIEAIKKADYIIFSPGDLYTSVLHNVVVDNIASAISKSRAKKIYIANLMTSFGETNDMDLGEHVSEIEKYVKSKIDCVVVNSKPISKAVVNEYAKKGQHVVAATMNAGQKARIKVVSADLISEKLRRKVKSDTLERSALVHDPKKLRRAILKILR